MKSVDIVSNTAVTPSVSCKHVDLVPRTSSCGAYNGVKKPKKTKKVRSEAEMAALRQRIAAGVEEIRVLKASLCDARSTELFQRVYAYMQEYHVWTMTPRSIRFRVNHMELAPAPLKLSNFVHQQSFTVTIPAIINRTALQRRIFVRFEDETQQFYDVELRVGTTDQFARKREKDTVVVKQLTSAVHDMVSLDGSVAMELAYETPTSTQRDITFEVIGNPRTKVLNVYFCGEIDHRLVITVHSKHRVMAQSVRMFKIKNNKLVNVDEFVTPACEKAYTRDIMGGLVENDSEMSDGHSVGDSDMEQKQSPIHQPKRYPPAAQATVDAAAMVVLPVGSGARRSTRKRRRAPSVDYTKKMMRTDYNNVHVIVVPEDNNKRHSMSSDKADDADGDRSVSCEDVSSVDLSRGDVSFLRFLAEDEDDEMSLTSSIGSDNVSVAPAAFTFRAVEPCLTMPAPFACSNVYTPFMW